MLILNTGQVPWDIKRQLETIYEPILARIQEDVPNIDVLGIDRSQRRTEAGQYQGSKLIEFFWHSHREKPTSTSKKKLLRILSAWMRQKLLPTIHLSTASLT